VALDLINDVFTFVFVCELLFKVYGLGPTQYAQSAWNKFDAVIVCISIVAFILRLVGAGAIGLDPTIFRVFRILRIFRLVKQAKGLKQLIQTLIFSFPALGNVGFLLFMLFFTYAIAGMNMFGNVKYGEQLNEHANFRNFWTSMVTLLRMATGENWNGLMHDCMVEEPECSEDEGNCGSYVSALLYFCSFNIFSSLLLLNVFVAIVLKNFEEEVNKDPNNTDTPVARDAIVQFGELWADMTPSAQYSMPIASLGVFINRLGKLGSPMGPEVALKRSEMLHFVHQLELPQDNGTVHYLDVCLALAERLFVRLDPEVRNIPRNNELLRAIKAQVYRLYPTLKRTKEYQFMVSHAYATLLLQRHLKVWMKRVHERRRNDDAKTESSRKKSIGVAYPTPPVNPRVLVSEPIANTDLQTMEPLQQSPMTSTRGVLRRKKTPILPPSRGGNDNTLSPPRASRTRLPLPGSPQQAEDIIDAPATHDVPIGNAVASLTSSGNVNGNGTTTNNNNSAVLRSLSSPPFSARISASFMSASIAAGGVAAARALMQGQKIDIQKKDTELSLVLPVASAADRKLDDSAAAVIRQHRLKQQSLDLEAAAAAKAAAAEAAPKAIQSTSPVLRSSSGTAATTAATATASKSLLPDSATADTATAVTTTTTIRRSSVVKSTPPPVDKQLVKIFAELSLSEFLGNFEAERISATDLSQLNEAHLTKLIPLIGPRLRLSRFINQVSSAASSSSSSSSAATAANDTIVVSPPPLLAMAALHNARPLRTALI
jgi:hypothetical protein